MPISSSLRSMSGMNFLMLLEKCMLQLGPSTSQDQTLVLAGLDF